jgi:Tfp pilus assembly protein PilN
MPIRINLLAEAQAIEEMRRKDPVKRSIWVGSFLVFVTLLVAATLQFKIIAARSEISTLQMSWKTMEKQVQDINEQRGKTRELEKKLSAIDQFTTNRMLWANVLNALQHTPVDGVQLVRVRAEQTFTLNDTGGKTNRPATVTERIVLSLDGRDFLLGDQVPRFKDGLAAYPYFADNLQKTNNVQLTSLSAPMSEGTRSFRAFGLQLFFAEKERQLYE